MITADVRMKTLLTATGETISYKNLIIATGARVLNLFTLILAHLVLLSITVNKNLACCI